MPNRVILTQPPLQGQLAAGELRPPAAGQRPRPNAPAVG